MIKKNSDIQSGKLNWIRPDLTLQPNVPWKVLLA